MPSKSKIENQNSIADRELSRNHSTVECDYTHHHHRRRLSASGSPKDGGREGGRGGSGSSSGHGNDNEMDGTTGRRVSSDLGVAGEALSSTGGGSDGGGDGGGEGAAEYFLCDVGSTNGTYVQVRRPCVTTGGCSVGAFFLYVSRGCIVLWRRLFRLLCFIFYSWVGGWVVGLFGCPACVCRPALCIPLCPPFFCPDQGLDFPVFNSILTRCPGSFDVSIGFLDEASRVDPWSRPYFVVVVGQYFCCVCS